jgi:hypothetical protein
LAAEIVDVGVSIVRTDPFGQVQDWSYTFGVGYSKGKLLPPTMSMELIGPDFDSLATKELPLRVGGNIQCQALTDDFYYIPTCWNTAIVAVNPGLHRLISSDFWTSSDSIGV